jgi:phosphocarrier protein
MPEAEEIQPAAYLTQNYIAKGITLPVVSHANMSGARKIGHESSSVTKELVVLNKLGVHARPSAMFVKTASRFECDVMVEKDGETVNGKSIMGLMMLAAGPGCKIQVHARGRDALQAVQELEALVTRKFDEE